MLSDVLKNNILEDLTLSLVKNVDDINELCKCLITTYGNPKVILQKKMAILANFIPLWKISNSEKTSGGLIKIINLIEELRKLADKV